MSTTHSTLINQRMMAGSEKQTILILCFFSQEMNIFKSHFPPLFFFFPFFINIFHVVIKSNSFFSKKKKNHTPPFIFAFIQSNPQSIFFRRKKPLLYLHGLIF